ncbi:MAG: zinc-binding dehydrogenase [Faecousia sp.]
MNEMNAVIFQDIATWGFEKRPVPQIRVPSDVLVEVEAASICGTDVHVLGNPPGFIGTKGIILGHECVGIVREVGSSVGGLKPGDRVVLVPNLHCGYCDYCRMGEQNMCSNERVMGVTCDGVFAKYFVAPEDALTKIPEDMPKDLAVFCEPVKCVMGAMDMVRLLPGENVLILGGGPIGLYFTMLFRANGAGKIIVSEPSAYRAEYAKECGADVIVDPTKENLQEIVRECTQGLGADVTVDAVGVLIRDAIACTRRRGRVVLMGQNGAVQETICQNDIVSNGLTIYGNYIGNFMMGHTVKMLSAGIIPVEKLITHRLPLSKFEEGLDAMRKGLGLEVILYPD